MMGTIKSRGYVKICLKVLEVQAGRATKKLLDLFIIY